MSSASSEAPSSLAEDHPPLRFAFITDPQLGMQGVGKTSDGKVKSVEQREEHMDLEAELFRSSVQAAIKLKPDFVVLGGDLQDVWPSPAHEASAQTGGLNATEREELEEAQVAAARGVVDLLSEAGIPTVILPGNHELDDVPTKAYVERYARRWGAHPANMANIREYDHDTLGGVLYGTFRREKYQFVHLTSQFYQQHLTPADPEALAFVQASSEEQTKWLREHAVRAANGAKLLVVFSHVPPYLDSVHETAGWGNWDSGSRRSVLETLAGVGAPILFVCGHFHANVVKEDRYQSIAGVQVPLTIMVTSSASTAMKWFQPKRDESSDDPCVAALDPPDGNDISPPDASVVASMAIGPAFDKNILRGCYSRIPAVLHKRLPADTHNAGLRHFVLRDAEYLQEWCTVEQFRFGSCAMAPLHL